MKTPEKIIVGNWKMNGLVQSLTVMLESLKKTDLTGVHVVICPPMPFLGAASVSNAYFGAQDVSAHENGPYTGEVSAEQIAETGAKYVIVGHSDRRILHFETNEIVAQKAARAAGAGLVPIICVGESAEERAAGRTFTVIEKQLRESIPAVAADFIIAYEPIWAISPAPAATTGDIEKAHAHIYNVLEQIGKPAPVIYGGSVDAANASEIMSVKNVDGIMAGRASLAPGDFLPIIEIGKKL
ncbi:MAG: triose-phosphate isomerase [Alphaproteobacteria bacterium]|nr:triose-phosphate isomerase [Alphaproteobacteria bacterium]